MIWHFTWGTEEVDDRLAELLRRKRTPAQEAAAQRNLRLARMRAWRPEVQAARAAQRWRDVPADVRALHCDMMRARRMA